MKRSFQLPVLFILCVTTCSLAEAGEPNDVFFLDQPAKETWSNQDENVAIFPNEMADERTSNGDENVALFPDENTDEESSNQSENDDSADESADDEEAKEDDFSTVYPMATPGLPWVGHAANFRFGWWGTHHSGDDVKVGEYQDLSPSPFWDVDGVFSDGYQTFNFIATGLDDEDNTARAYIYDPNLSVKFEYDRFPHRLDHDPLRGTPITGPIGIDDNVVTEDLNLGDDYAIRVQELKTSIKGQLGDNVKWRVNLWGLRKSGERQANAMGHCFDLDPAPGSQQNKCHVLSQRQRIDWLTMEIEPVVEARFNDFIVNYARTMRTFGQNDQTVTRTYTRFDFSPSSGEGGPPFDYAIVPESFTQIDRLKVSGPLTENNQLYAYLFHGDTKNEFRQTHRTYNGADVRVINNAFEGVTFTAYGSVVDEDNDLPSTLLPEEIVIGEELRHPINYVRSRTGIKGQWRPFRDCSPGDGCFDPWSQFLLTGGYEYYSLERDFAVYESSRLGTFSQPDTKRHEINLGSRMRWSLMLDSFARYRARFTQDPLIGVRESTGRFNTNQPEQEHGIDIGGTWKPADNFMAMVQFSIVNSWNQSLYPSDVGDNPINFTEDSYPVVSTIWYAPTEKLTLAAGYSYFTNWIDQDVSIGFRQDPIETLRADYEGTNEIVSLRANYAWSPRLSLIGGLERNDGTNRFSLSPSTAGADYSQLPSYSDVVVETMRYTAGFDYQLRPSIGTYFRYNYFDFEDKSENFNSGTANFLLAGINALY